MAVNIDKTASIDISAKIGVDVTIGPGAVIGPDVEIGDRTAVGPGAYICRDTVIGSDCNISFSACVGTDPQDLKYDGGKYPLIIGANVVIREFASLNRGTKEHGETRICDNAFIMTYCHVAHDCVVGENVILSNGVQLAGHVRVDEWASIGGLTPVHQFVNIGKHAFVGGGLRINQDVPPFVIANGQPAKMSGVNMVGLKRRGFSEDDITRIKKIYRFIYRREARRREALVAAEKEMGADPFLTDVLGFFSDSRRGVM
ncbi:MAG: acyl-ACP--UDP-N-acetylglucosamine O-acyltransferase [Fibrobacterota bacterium]